MPQIEEKYDQSRIDVLKRYLQREATNGRPKDYEILVDGFKVIPRTRNIDEFEDYEIEMREDTRNVSVLIYDGPVTPRNTKYSFRVVQKQEKPADGGNGLGEVEQLIQQKLDEKDRVYELEKLKDKLAATAKQLEEAEEYNGQLEQQLEEARTNKYNLGSINIADLGSQLLEYAFKRHAHKFPGGDQLAGFLNMPGPILPGQPPQGQGQGAETEATFQKEDAPQLSENELCHLHNFRIMEQQLSPQQMQTTIGILKAFCEHPEQTDIVATLLDIKTASI